MSESPLFPRVAAVLARVFACDVDDFEPETAAADIEKWDSLNNIKMLLQIEKEFGVRFNGMETTSLENVGELVTLIETKLAAAGKA
jgi:acyl carrier protein